MATTWNGQLTANVIYNNTFNAYELVKTISDQLKGLKSSVADQFKEDASPYGTEKVYTDFDILKSYEFDPNDTNVLVPGQKVLPKQEKITIDKTRQISLYTPTKFLTKTAWMSEGSWSEFNSVVQKDISDTKKVYDYLLGMTAIGTLENGGNQNFTITLPKNTATTFADKEAYNRLAGTKIASEIEDIFIEVCDVGRKYNGYGFMKSFAKEDFVFVYNTNMVNKILHIDLPTLYHTDSTSAPYKGDRIRSAYFGKPNVAAVAKAQVAEGKYRALEENDYATAAGAAMTHCYPGDIIPAGSCRVTEYTDGTKTAAKTVATQLEIGEAYENDATILGKFIHKDAIKYLVGYQTESEFWNAKNLSTNRYLTWFFANPKAISSYPIITVRVVTEA